MCWRLEISRHIMDSNMTLLMSTKLTRLKIHTSPPIQTVTSSMYSMIKRLAVVHTGYPKSMYTCLWREISKNEAVDTFSEIQPLTMCVLIDFVRTSLCFGGYVSNAPKGDHAVLGYHPQCAGKKSSSKMNIDNLT